MVNFWLCFEVEMWNVSIKEDQQFNFRPAGRMDVRFSKKCSNGGKCEEEGQ